MGRITFNLDEKLLALLGREALVKQWWESQNKAFDLDTPEQVWRTDPDRVVKYVNQFCGGDYS